MQTYSAKKFCKETSPFVTDTDQSKRSKTKDPCFYTKSKYTPRNHPQRNRVSTSDTTCNNNSRRVCFAVNYGNHTLSIVNST